MTIPILRQQSDWMGWVRKMAIFSDVQYYLYWRRVGGSEKVKKCADVIEEWSLSNFFIFDKKMNHEPRFRKTNDVDLILFYMLYSRAKKKLSVQVNHEIKNIHPKKVIMY